jgi:16S rRNA (guanine(966)-N(2))-methyltransferase RsmD
MRIIAGEFRGRKLLPPVGDTTRPITDRAKQSIFDVLQPRMEDAVVYDCFAGTGSMGLECLSRGCRTVMFFEQDRSALTRLRQNIATLSLEARSTVISGDIFKWSASADDAALSVDLVFFDPPYRFLHERASELQDLAAVLAQCHLSSDGIFIFRHDRDDSLELPFLKACEVRDYGSMRVELLASAKAS